MRRVGLSTILIGGNVGIVLIVSASVLFAASGRLRRLADDQALARARLAGASASGRIERTAEELVTSARLLAERPTLARMLAAREREALSGFLDQFRGTSRLAGCALLVERTLLASGGEPLPWEEIARAVPADSRPFLLRHAAGGPLLLGAGAAVLSDATALVLVALKLDEGYANRLSAEIGVEVRILDRRAAVDPRAGAGAELRRQVIDAEQPAAARVEALGEYVAASPLRFPPGGLVGLLEVGLPTAEIDASVRGLIRTLLAVAIGVAALATAFGFVIGRRLVGPLEELTSASVRIGRGDFSTPVPRAVGAEIGTLSTTMEEMRGRLLRLTGELNRRQAEAEAILLGIAEGVFAVDRERRILYLNPQAALLLGIAPEQARGRFCGDVLLPEATDGVRPCEERCPIVHARSSGSAWATENLVLASGERRSVVITSSSPDFGRAEHPADGSRQFQVMRDETEIEATRRLRDTVLANISHEFRTPLAAQLASLELLRDRIADLTAEEARGLVLSLERGTLRLTQLVDNLLESVRIEAGRDSIRRAPIALDEVVEQAIESTAPLIAQREQELTVELPYPLPLVGGDGPRLVQVFVNLLANANKFAPPSSPIRVGGSVAETEVVLWVEDEGPGLPPDGDEFLFRRFVRSSGEEPEQSGMGLGLWIVKSIVERHGGRVGAAPGRGGQGMRVSVILPLDRPPEVPAGGAAR